MKCACLLVNVQHDLFDLGGEVCIPGMEMITAKQVQHLEDELDRFNDDLEPLKDFILPGGTRAAALPPGPHDLPTRRADDRRAGPGRSRE
jgi:ATP:cob(I)alamin adenosyltransferase